MRVGRAVQGALDRIPVHTTASGSRDAKRQSKESMRSSKCYFRGCEGSERVVAETTGGMSVECSDLPSSAKSQNLLVTEPDRGVADVDKPLFLHSFNVLDLQTYILVDIM